MSVGYDPRTGIGLDRGRTWRRSSAALVGLALTASIIHGSARAAPPLPEIDPNLSAFALVTGEAYDTTLKQTVLGPEDLGGGPLIDGYYSSTRVATEDGVTWLIEMFSRPDVTDAEDLFDQFVGGALDPGASEVAGAGDEAMVANGKAVLRKGAQLLLVSETATGDGVAPPELILRILDLFSERMTGQSAQGGLPIDLPYGAADPCASQPANAQSAFNAASATVLWTPGARFLPAVHCEVVMDIFGFSAFLLCEQQLANTLQPTTVRDRFEEERQAALAANGADIQGLGQGAFIQTTPNLELSVIVTAQDASRCIATMVVPGGFPPNQDQNSVFFGMQNVIRGMEAALPPVVAPPTTTSTSTTTTTTTTPAATSTTTTSVAPPSGTTTTAPAATTTIAPPASTTTTSTTVVEAGSDEGEAAAPLPPAAGPSDDDDGGGGGGGGSTGTVVAVGIPSLLALGITGVFVTRRRRRRRGSRRGGRRRRRGSHGLAIPGDTPNIGSEPGTTTYTATITGDDPFSIGIRPVAGETTHTATAQEEP